MPPLSMFGLSVNFMHINSAGQPRQLCIADKSGEKPSLFSYWVRTKYNCRQNGAVHPINNFLSLHPLKSKASFTQEYTCGWHESSAKSSNPHKQ